MGNSVIFTEKEVKPFTATSGVLVALTQCKLTDGRAGWYGKLEFAAEINERADIVIIDLDLIVQSPY